MSKFNLFGRLSASPTNPKNHPKAKSFDVADLYAGPFGADNNELSEQTLGLDEKLRQAYFWIVNNAIISPHYDIEYNDKPPQQFRAGDSHSTINLPTEQSYSSYILLPLLTFATQSKCLFIGGPGRGKTASALLMGVLGGYTTKEVKRAMQHGHPQMTVADLLGNPLPADLATAQSVEDIRISWRKWLGMRVKIVDEYNRIPTRTQSSLLTVMGDNYAELYNQVFECPDAAWFLTANDDQGGGTYQVIEALKDRIDVVVQALSFNPRFLSQLLLRIEEGVKPEDMVPPQIIFSEDEISQMSLAIRNIEIPDDIRRRIEFFGSHFEFSEYSASQFEYKTKDTSRLSGVKAHILASMDNGRDRLKDLGCQTLNGISVRSLMSLLQFSKALAYFRGNDAVELDDVRQVLPFVFHSRLFADCDSPFFELPENAFFRSDKIGWLRFLFDSSCREFDRLGLGNSDSVEALSNEFDEGLDGLTVKAAKKRINRIETEIAQLVEGKKMYGHIYEDVVKLKYLHQRYTNYLKWLES
ncbi:AAA family ATPase [Alkalimarinus alittae]|uniref:MoxR family ATPase n=1 Tax=Alkalimarinus alittae TaxID=2961619 RepID=A0ABY6MY88_9ALTE|nr:MoxR family ATPase [Alkalimarinus alittae]UZE94801.1 MoxR family ATPase [Alkalimarinus alittae]